MLITNNVIIGYVQEKNRGLKKINDNFSVYNCQIACKNPYQKKGEKTKLIYYFVQTTNKLAEICDKFIKTNSKVLFSGYIDIRSYKDKDGKYKQAVIYKADKMLLLDPAPAREKNNVDEHNETWENEPNESVPGFDEVNDKIPDPTDDDRGY